MAELTTVENRDYENRRLKVDGGRFVRCRFVNCKLISYANQEVSFEGCFFQECDWIFEDAADRTLRYLAMLYNQGGPAGAGVFEATIDTLRTDVALESMTAVSAAS